MIEYIIRGLLNGAVYGILALPMSLLFAAAGTVGGTARSRRRPAVRARGIGGDGSDLRVVEA
jgi:hypothetical protein